MRRRRRLSPRAALAGAWALGFALMGLVHEAPASAAPGSTKTVDPNSSGKSKSKTKIIDPDKRGSKVHQPELGEEARLRAKQKAESSSSSQVGPRLRRAGPDQTRLPRMGHPTVHRRAPKSRVHALTGWAGAVDRPPIPDRRMRMFPVPPPIDYGDSLRPGERFWFDVFFAGNPAGMAEAGVERRDPDPRGGPPAGSPTVVISGRAVTSGVLSLLATAEDRMTSVVDSQTGATVSTVNRLDRSGIGAKTKHRRTETDFEGRGYVRIVDTKDGRRTKLTRSVPRDTLDPLGAMAWVRSLDLGDGEHARAHVLDGKALLRVEVVGRGHADLDPMPTIAEAIGVKKGDLLLLEGQLTRVDKYDRPREGKRTINFRAYLSDDDRRLLLALETDMWLGVIRLVLARYDPPRDQQPENGENAAESPE